MVAIATLDIVIDANASLKPPVITGFVGLSAACLFLLFGPGLMYHADSTDEWWRLFSSQLSHYDSRHLLLNVFVFSIAGTMVERLTPRTMWAITIVVVMGVTAALLKSAVLGLATFAGMSALNYAAITLLLTVWWHNSRWQAVAGFLALIVGLINPWMSTAEPHSPVPLVHAVGVSAGLFAGLWLCRVRQGEA